MYEERKNRFAETLVPVSCSFGRRKATRADCFGAGDAGGAEDARFDAPGTTAGFGGSLSTRSAFADR